MFTHYIMITLMKKLIILFAAYCIGCGTTLAQSWTDALKKVATDLVDKATDGKLTEKALVGTWNYTGPGVKFSSDDILGSLGGAAIETTVEEKLATLYGMVGIREGACSFTFTDDDTFTATMGGRELKGDYEYDASTHAITLKFSTGKFNLGSVPGYAYISGTQLQLVFPVDKLMEIVKSFGSKISSLSTVVNLLEKYENVYIGFAFSRS